MDTRPSSFVRVITDLLRLGEMMYFAPASFARSANAVEVTVPAPDHDSFGAKLCGRFQRTGAEITGAAYDNSLFAGQVKHILHVFTPQKLLCMRPGEGQNPFRILIMEGCN